VQPQKRHATLLNAQCEGRQLDPFLIVPTGSTVTYLGVEMGLAPLTEINWLVRERKIANKLGALSRYTSSIPDRVTIINMACTASLLFRQLRHEPD
jgi:hypothetical protein